MDRPTSDLLHFEDFQPGSVREFGAYEVTKDEIIAFAREFDAQAFHLDEAAAKASLLGGLAASGWHTGGIMMRLNCEEWALRTASMGGPGIDDMRWLKPVRPGDVLTCRMTIGDTRVSRNRPEMGLVRMLQDLRNQNGETVLTASHLAMLIRRDPTPLPDSAPATPRATPPAAPLPDPVDTDGDGRIGWYEDLVIGARMDLGTYVFERETMIRFAGAFDPQRFHVDDTAAAQSHFGRLSASGWHTAAGFMRLWVQTRDRLAAAMQAAGEQVPTYGPSPGIRDLHWLRPVYAGDALSYSTMLIDKRPISRPGWAVVTSYNEGTNQDGVKVFDFISAALCPMRPVA